MLHIFWAIWFLTSFCEGVLKHFIWNGHCFLLPTLRIISCLFSETFFIQNLISVDQPSFFWLFTTRDTRIRMVHILWVFFATCPDKCNIQFYIANILIAANMKDRGTDFRFWWREIQSAQFAELWCLNMSINRFWPICIFLIECAVLCIWYPILNILFLGNSHRVCFKWDILQVWNEFKALAPEFLVYIGLLSD